MFTKRKEHMETKILQDCGDELGFMICQEDRAEVENLKTEIFMVGQLHGRSI